jgi:hypothetical protein
MDAELSELMEAEEEYGDGKSSRSMELSELRSLMDSIDSEFQLELEDSADCSDTMEGHPDDWDSSEEKDGDSSEETETDSRDDTEGDSSDDDMDSSEDIEREGAVGAADPAVDMTEVPDSCVDMKPSADSDSMESSDEPIAMMLSLSVDMLERLLEGKEVMELAVVSELSSSFWMDTVSSELVVMSPPPCICALECESSTTAVSRMSTTKMPMMVWMKVEGLRCLHSSSFFLARVLKMAPRITTDTM